uniref:MARVEL domain-containing protein n=1 Tax=Chrysemys picta bellii TaxID=8478 RepID=A0A8C3FXK2_CHRPI
PWEIPLFTSLLCENCPFIPSLCFLGCTQLLIPQSRTHRLLSSPPPALWTFLWFVGFCFLTNQWAMTLPSEVHVGADSARAAIAFSFFSIFSWGFLITFALQRYRMGVEDFTNSYTDPTPDPSTPYSIYPNVTHDNYQQPPFTQPGETSEGYQPPAY